MFPEDGEHEGDEAMGIADLMVMERAHKRRKEIEIEERDELQNEETKPGKHYKEVEMQRARLAKIAQNGGPPPRLRPLPKNTYAAASSTSGMDFSKRCGKIDSDTETTTLRSGAEGEAGPTPNRLETSDSEDFVELLSILPQKLRPACSDTELEIKTSFGRRSPPLASDEPRKAPRKLLPVSSNGAPGAGGAAVLFIDDEGDVEAVEDGGVITIVD
ncbi:hypothetical protein B0H13DRAFT_1934900 [Mycena leptocephala]|nr:hypothetical protein B0H13DRAFT_1934900 [Mycena leptocephala]